MFKPVEFLGVLAMLINRGLDWVEKRQDQADERRMRRLRKEFTDAMQRGDGAAATRANATIQRIVRERKNRRL